jgi:hypothetical protein
MEMIHQVTHTESHMSDNNNRPCDIDPTTYVSDENLLLLLASRVCTSSSSACNPAAAAAAAARAKCAGPCLQPA